MTKQGGIILVSVGVSNQTLLGGGNCGRDRKAGLFLQR